MSFPKNFPNRTAAKGSVLLVENTKHIRKKAALSFALRPPCEFLRPAIHKRNAFFRIGDDDGIRDRKQRRFEEVAVACRFVDRLAEAIDKLFGLTPRIQTNDNSQYKTGTGNNKEQIRRSISKASGALVIEAIFFGVQPLELGLNSQREAGAVEQARVLGRSRHRFPGSSQRSE